MLDYEGFCRLIEEFGLDSIGREKPVGIQYFKKTGGGMADTKVRSTPLEQYR